MTSVNIIFMY